MASPALVRMRQARLNVPGAQQPQQPPATPYEIAKQKLRGALIIDAQPVDTSDPHDYSQSAYSALKYGGEGGIRGQLLQHLQERIPALLEGIKAGLHHAGQNPTDMVEKGLIAQSVPTKLHQALEESGYGRAFLARHPGRTFGRYV